jgi:peptide deformylase
MPAKKNSPKLLPKDFYGLTDADRLRAAQERELGMIAADNPLLMSPATAVKAGQIDSQHVKDIIGRLYEAASGQRRNSRQGKRRRTLVGLAAPQIGESLRIILVDTTVELSRKKYGKLECFINPKIIWHSRETDEAREGCFSAGQVWGLVRRPIAVKIQALDIEGETVERILEGFTARIAQHEIDHLNGVRFPDRIRGDKKRHWVHAEELDEYPKQIKHWHRLCSRERWEQVKGTTPTQ